MPDGTENLTKVEHIVVLMLENRSFDHMLGYLSLEGGRGDIDGLQDGMANVAEGVPYPINHLTRTVYPGERWDPGHSRAETDHQMNGGKMDGFAAAFASKLGARRPGDPDPGLVMGYYNASDLPVYDHLAAEFCVCDRWHSSVPGATWPNRLYAAAGSADGSRDDKDPPIYSKPSFIRHLDAAGVSWRWYSFDVGTLHAVDDEYRIGHYDHFAYVEKVKLSWKTELEELVVIDEFSSSFLEDAARGHLPSVSWIDPNFKDINMVGTPPNDDHAPSDVENGQELVFLIYNALASSPQWNKTMLLITYDEHGGFHDHVEPPANPPDDDPATFNRYGIRVPMIVVSPWVGRASVSNELFDHTSTIKTILTRFCPQELDQESGFEAKLHWLLDSGNPRYMGKRVAAASDLGSLLSEPAPRQPPDRSALVDWVANRRAATTRKILEQPATTIKPAEERTLTDLQRGIARIGHDLYAKGQPPGQP